MLEQEMEEEKNIINLLENKESKVIELLLHPDVINMKNNQRVGKFFVPEKILELFRYSMRKNFGLTHSDYAQLTALHKPEALIKIPFVANELLKADSLLEVIMAQNPHECYTKNYPVEENKIQEGAMVKSLGKKEIIDIDMIIRNEEKAKINPLTAKQPKAGQQNVEQPKAEQPEEVNLRVEQPKAGQQNVEQLKEANLIEEKLKEASLKEDKPKEASIKEETPFEEASKKVMPKEEKPKENKFDSINANFLLKEFFSFLHSSDLENPTILGYFCCTFNGLIIHDCKRILTYMDQNKLFIEIVPLIHNIAMIDTFKNIINTIVDNKEDFEHIRAYFIQLILSTLSVTQGTTCLTRRAYENIALFMRNMIDIDIIEFPQLQTIISLITHPITLGDMKMANDKMKIICSLDIITSLFNKIKEKNATFEFTNYNQLMKAIVGFLCTGTPAEEFGLMRAINAAMQAMMNLFIDKDILESLGRNLLIILKAAKGSSTILSQAFLVYDNAQKLDKEYIGCLINKDLIDFLKSATLKPNDPMTPIVFELAYLLKKLKSQGKIAKLDNDIKKIYHTFLEETDKPLYSEQIKCPYTKIDALKAYYETYKDDIISNIDISESENYEDLQINKI